MNMSRISSQIKNYVQLHTSDMDNRAYIELMRELAEWAESQADMAEYRDDNDTVFPMDQ